MSFRRREIYNKNVSRSCYVKAYDRMFERDYQVYLIYLHFWATLLP